MKKYLPGTLALLHYRNFDTNALWLLQGFITGEEPTRPKKESNHRAVDDCKMAISAVESHFNFFVELAKHGD